MPPSRAFDVSVAIVGAGPAGLGCAALLRQMQLPYRELLVLERGVVGDSFRRWPKEMRLITPSFPSNGFHQTDLNSITPDTSPAFSLGEEHPTGEQYADYLCNLVDHYDIPVAERRSVVSVAPLDEGFQIQSDNGQRLSSRFLIWAGGEYQTPVTPDFDGAHYARHNSEVRAYAEEPGEEHLLVGAYESGVDAAWHLIEAGKKVILLERRADRENTYDPSRVLSPVSQRRLASLQHNPRFQLFTGREVIGIEQANDSYRVRCQTGEDWTTSQPPILCTGFDVNLGPVESLFLYDGDGAPLTNPFDESTLVPGLFLTGPQLSYGEILLCFIYKFRGRFPVVCGTIGAELELDPMPLEHYQQAGMLLDDLSCCADQQCFC